MLRIQVGFRLLAAVVQRFVGRSISVNILSAVLVCIRHISSDSSWSSSSHVGFLIVMKAGVRQWSSFN
jgi:hypothetical protein